MKQLLEQIDIIQKMLLDYRVEDAYIFGSRIYEKHNKFSDLDIVLCLKNAVKSIKSNYSTMNQLHSMSLTAEEYSNILMNPVVSKIKNTIKLDVNIIGEYTIERLNIDIYNNKVAIIKNYEPINLSVIERNIQKVRISSKLYQKNENDLDTILYSNLNHIAELFRYFTKIDTFEKFKNPKEKSLIAMRNSMITEVCLFCSIVDRIKQKSFEEWNINYNQLSLLNELIKEKKNYINNYNSSALSWIDCPKSIFSIEELNLLWTFIINHIKIGKKLMLTKDFFSVRRKLISAIENNDAFMNTYELEYDEHTNLDIFNKEYEYNKDYFMALKKEKRKLILSDDMKKIFNDELSFPEIFNACYLYNDNRSSWATYEKMFIEEMCKNGFVDAINFKIDTYPYNKEEQTTENFDYTKSRMHEINCLKEYNREYDSTIGALRDFIKVLEKNNIEVIKYEKYTNLDNKIPYYARAYVPKWDMIINPATQNIETLLDSLFDKKSIVCIIDGDYKNNCKALLVKCKEPFFYAYETLQNRKIEKQMKFSKSLHEHLKSVSLFEDSE